MSLHLDLLKLDLRRLVADIPVQIFFCVAGVDGIIQSAESEVLHSMVMHPEWSASWQIQEIIKATLKIHTELRQVVNFRGKEDKLKGSVDLIRSGLHVVERFSSPKETPSLLKDLKFFAEEIARSTGKRGGTIGPKEERVLKEINQCLDEFPTEIGYLEADLIKLPFLLFRVVAAADGDVDESERSRFLSILRNNECGKSALAQEYYTRTLYAYSHLLKKYRETTADVILERISKTTAQAEAVFDAEEIKAFKSDLYEMSEEIAIASGGFIGFGAIDRKEKNILARIKDYFSTGDSKVKVQKQSKSYTRREKRVGTKGAIVMVGEGKTTIAGQIVNMTPTSVLCRLKLGGASLDVLKGYSLSIELHQINISKIEGKLIRLKTEFWKEDHSPKEVSVVWEFVSIPESELSKLKSILSLFTN